MEGFHRQKEDGKRKLRLDYFRQSLGKVTSLRERQGALGRLHHRS